MDLAIHTTMGFLGLDFQLPQIRVSQTPAIFTIQQTAPQIEIKAKLPQVKIDQTACFEDTGVRSDGKMLAFYARKAKADVLQGIAERVDEGDRLSKGTNGYTIAKEAYHDSINMRAFGLEAIPKHRPKVTVDSEAAKISLKAGEVKVNGSKGETTIQAPYQAIRTFWIQKPEVEITYTGEWIV
ncbi:MAG: DUF6470 family protein [Solirubrobacterales bacterium]